MKGNFEAADNRKQVMLLVRNRKQNQIKMLVIFIDPWKDIQFHKEFDVKEHIFVVKGSNIVLP